MQQNIKKKKIMVEPKVLMLGDCIYNHRMWECPITEMYKREHDENQWVVSVIARHYGEETFFAKDMNYIPLSIEFFQENSFVDFIAGQMVYTGEKPRDDFFMSVIKGFESLPNSGGAKFCVCVRQSYHDEKVPMTYVHEYQQLLRRCKMSPVVKFPKVQSNTLL